MKKTKDESGPQEAIERGYQPKSGNPQGGYQPTKGNAVPARPSPPNKGSAGKK